MGKIYLLRKKVKNGHGCSGCCFKKSIKKCLRMGCYGDKQGYIFKKLKEVSDEA